MKPPIIPLENIRQSTLVYRLTIPEDYQDYNGHMNIRWYMGIFDDAGLVLYDDIGLTPEKIMAQGYTTFDLEHHIHYINEVRVGDETTIYTRIIGRSAKRMHYLMFMINETRSTLASIFECVSTFVDLSTRRTTPYTEEVASPIDKLLSEHQALSWDAPVSGTMRA